MLNLISNDIKTIISNKRMNQAEHHKADENRKDENDRFLKDEIAVLKTIISTHVNYDEMNVVMTDIKESLELYINETPRDNNRSELDDMYLKMESMTSQIDRLTCQLEQFKNMPIPRLEILDAPKTRDIVDILPQTTKIPKLVIKRSLKV